LNEFHIVPYLGRDGNVQNTDNVYQEAIVSLLDLTEKTSKLSAAKKDPVWSNLCSELSSFTNGLLDSKRPIKRYQLDLLLDTVVPYLQEIQGRFHTDNTRFSQIKSVLQIINETDDTSSFNSTHMNTENGEIFVNHSYHSLIKLEKLIKEIDRQGGLWRSKLSQLLEQGVKKQWSPIIIDHQRALMNIGGKLCMLGLVEAVGRPIVMLYPLFLAAQEVLKIATEYDVKKTVSTESILQMGKMIVMLIAVVQLAGILAMYSGLGYTCLALGGSALFVGSNDELTKSAVPILAVHMASISVFLSQIVQLEKKAYGVFNTLASRNDSIDGNNDIRSSQVEELPPLDVTPDVSPVPIPTPFRVDITVAQETSASTSSDLLPIAIPLDTWHDVPASGNPIEERTSRDSDEYVFAELDVYTAQVTPTETSTLRNRRR
jgi:hypothetical protein